MHDQRWHLEENQTLFVSLLNQKLLSVAQIAVGGQAGIFNTPAPSPQEKQQQQKNKQADKLNNQLLLYSLGLIVWFHGSLFYLSDLYVFCFVV